MYLFECIWKWIFPKKLSQEYEYNPLQSGDIEDDTEDCNHEFMPVDSTGETLACIKCGFIVKRYGNDITKD